MSGSEFSIYIVRCADDSYYTGITADVERRLAEHRNGPRGAKYLKGRGPITLVFSESVGNRSTAAKLEYRVKQLDRSGKEDVISGRTTLSDLT